MDKGQIAVISFCGGGILMSLLYWFDFRNHRKIVADNKKMREAVNDFEALERKVYLLSHLSICKSDRCGIYNEAIRSAENVLHERAHR